MFIIKMSEKKYTKYDIFIKRIMSDLIGDNKTISISSNSINLLDKLIKVLLSILSETAYVLSNHGNRNTILINDIISATRLKLTHNLSEFAINVLNNKVDTIKKFQSNGKKTTTSDKSKLYLPVSRIHKYVREFIGDKKIGDMTAVALTAVVENIIAEILSTTIHNNPTINTITPLHIKTTIFNDQELSHIFKNYFVLHNNIL